MGQINESAKQNGTNLTKKTLGKQNIQRLEGKISEQVSSEFVFCHLPT